MLFNSLQYLVFFPLVVAIVLGFSKSMRWLPLLVASYYFYMCWRAEYAILIVASTAMNYFSALALARLDSQTDPDSDWRRKSILITSVALNLAILFLFKNWNFFGESFNSACRLVDIPARFPELNLLLPMGISFYTFQSLSQNTTKYVKLQDVVLGVNFDAKRRQTMESS